MKSKIDNNFYCSANSFKSTVDVAWCRLKNSPCYSKCENHHRKWPTPQQFFEEYGEEYQDDAVVYFVNSNDTYEWWDIGTYREIKKIDGEKIVGGERIQFSKKEMVCACTPFGKPPDKWRPE